MYIFTPQNTSSTRITVTGTSIPLYTLMDTAGSILTSESYYQAAKANALLIRPEDGDIRVFSKATPTSTLGTLLKNGTMYYFAGVDFTNFNLIRTSGSVACSIQLGLALAGESSFAASVDALSVSLDEFPAAAALTDNFATPTTTVIGAFNMVYDGATWDFARGTAADGALVNLGANNDVTITNSTATASAPTSVSVGVASALAVAANASRKGLVLTNVRANTGQIALSLVAASAAVLNSGIVLYPGDSFTMDTMTFTAAQLNAISDVAAQTLAIQELI